MWVNVLIERERLYVAHGSENNMMRVNMKEIAGVRLMELSLIFISLHFFVHFGHILWAEEEEQCI